jgi:GNAT superfamily N-acetyltransferase
MRDPNRTENPAAITEIRSVDFRDMGRLAHLTFPAFASAFSEAPPGGSPFRPYRLAAFAEGKPIGLALATLETTSGHAELRSLVVDRSHRRMGTARGLLDQMETWLRDDGGQHVSACFSDQLPGANGFAALLAGAGWSAPEPERIRILGRVGKTSDVFRDRERLVQRAFRDGLSIIPWRDHAGDPRSLILREIEAGRAPDWAQIGLLADTVDPEFSMILTDGAGQVVGWVICQFHAGIRRWGFPVGWIHQEHQKRGWLLVAYAQGAHLIETRHGPDAIAVFESSSGLPMMWRVLEHRFAPHAERADRLLVSRKRL